MSVERNILFRANSLLGVRKKGIGNLLFVLLLLEVPLRSTFQRSRGITRQRRPRPRNPGMDLIGRSEPTMQDSAQPYPVQKAGQWRLIIYVLLQLGSLSMETTVKSREHISRDHVRYLYLALAIRAIPLLLSYLNYITYNRITATRSFHTSLELFSS
jgi:hypothetical protein